MAKDSSGPEITQPIDIEKEMQDSFLEYAMSVIVSRALPDVKDGLKPVHRRVLYSMWDSGIRPGTLEKVSMTWPPARSASEAPVPRYWTMA